jgi:hypothetical protein
MITVVCCILLYYLTFVENFLSCVVVKGIGGKDGITDNERSTKNRGYSGSDGQGHRYPIRRLLTVDLVRNFSLHRPWQEQWRSYSPSDTVKAQYAGHLYTSYYEGRKTDDLERLYYDFRESKPGDRRFPFRSTNKSPVACAD